MSTEHPRGPSKVIPGDASFDPEAAGWKRHEGKGFMELIGPIWEHEDEDGMVFGFLAEDKHHNRRGVVQGGMLMTFADRVLGSVGRAQNENKPQATLQMDTHFIEAVNVGDFVTGRAWVKRLTRSVIFMEGELRVGPKLVASITGIWKILTPRQPAK